MQDFFVLIQAFENSCHCWYQTTTQLLIHDTSPATTTTCFNIVQNAYHVYLHSSMSNNAISPAYVMANYTHHADMVGALNEIPISPPRTLIYNAENIINRMFPIESSKDS